LAIAARGGRVHVRPNATNNPSARRDAVSIEFWCEQCDFDGALTLVQRKGETCVQWA
jgi:hypothetical protein